MDIPRPASAGPSPIEGLASRPVDSNDFRRHAPPGPMARDFSLRRLRSGSAGSIDSSASFAVLPEAAHFSRILNAIEAIRDRAGFEAGWRAAQDLPQGCQRRHAAVALAGRMWFLDATEDRRDACALLLSMMRDNRLHADSRLLSCLVAEIFSTPENAADRQCFMALYGRLPDREKQKVDAANDLTKTFGNSDALVERFGSLPPDVQIRYVEDHLEAIPLLPAALRFEPFLAVLRLRGYVVRLGDESDRHRFGRVVDLLSAGTAALAPEQALAIQCATTFDGIAAASGRSRPDLAPILECVRGRPDTGEPLPDRETAFVLNHVVGWVPEVPERKRVFILNQIMPVMIGRSSAAMTPILHAIMDRLPDLPRHRAPSVIDHLRLVQDHLNFAIASDS